MQEQKDMVWTGTGWVRNPALPPLPEPVAPEPKPGFYGGSFVPAYVKTTIPNAAIHRPPPPPGLGVHASPQTPIAVQHTIPAPVVVPQAAMQAAIMAGQPLPTGFVQPQATVPPQPVPGMIPSPLGGGYMIPNPAAAPPVAPPSAPPRPTEGALEFADEPQSATMLVPAEPPPPPPKLDPIAEQIAKARAAAQSGKL